jgi:hypothetical protein
MNERDRSLNLLLLMPDHFFRYLLFRVFLNRGSQKETKGTKIFFKDLDRTFVYFATFC